MTDGEASQVFVDLVAASRRHSHEAFVNSRVGDAVIGAVIVWAVGHGYLLIGLNSDGENFFASPDEINHLRPAELDPSLRRELNALIALATRRLSVEGLLEGLQQGGRRDSAARTR